MVRSLCRPIVLSSFLVVAACSSDKAIVDANGDGIDDGVVTPNNVTVVTPSEPKGYVAAMIVSAATGAPLANATVTLFGGGISGSATTDDRGELSFGPIAAGASFALHASADGFLDVTLANLSIDDAAGNFPTKNGALFVGPIGLVPSSGSFAVQVVSRAGEPVSGAEVTFEARPRYVLGDVVAGSFVASATTDLDGVAKVTGLPDVRALPGSIEGSIDVSVAPVDLDSNGTTDLVGTTMTIADDELRRGGRAPVIIVGPEERQALRVVASNVAGLVTAGSSAISIIGANEDIRLVFNQPVERESTIVDLRDETGATTLAVQFLVGTTGNTMSISPVMPLDAARQFGLTVHVETRASGVPQVYDGAAYFFTAVDPSAQLGLVARIRDANHDQQWGTGDDFVELTMSAPIGKPGAITPFILSLWLQVDLDGSGTIGDNTGELPESGTARPMPRIVTAQTYGWITGVSLPGYSRFAAPIPFGLAVPRLQTQGGVVFEAQIVDQDGRRIADVSGRPVATRLTGTALLQ